MKTGHLKRTWQALVCLAVVGGALSLQADGNPYSQLRTLWKSPAHSNGITRAVLFTADGAQVISAGDDGTVKFFRRSDGEVVTNVPAHSGRVHGLALSADGSLLASGGQDRLLKIWRVADATLLRSFLAHTTFVASVAFSPDGSFLASGGGPDNQLKIWRVADGQLIRTITGTRHPSSNPSMLSVAFSPDGRFVAGSGPEIWLSSDGSFVRTINRSADYDVKFSPDGSRIIALEHYTVWIVNLDSGAVEPYPGDAILRPWSAFSPDGVSLFSASVSDARWVDFRNRSMITNYSCSPGWCTNLYSSVAFDPQMRSVALGTDVGEVVLAELPLWISNIQRAGTHLTIQWQGGTGPFQLQSTSDVTSPTWNDVGAPVTGSAISAPVNESSAIYRVRDLGR